MRPAPVPQDIASSQNIATRITCDGPGEPVGICVSTNEYEQPATVVAPHVVAGCLTNVDRRQARVTVDRLHLRLQFDGDVRLTAQCDMVFSSDLPRTRSVTVRA